jgi:hypothetical protein
MEPDRDRPVVPEPQLLALLVPILLIELALIVFALLDLRRPDRRVKGDSKLVWALIIVFVGTIGPILYFLVGREPE